MANGDITSITLQGKIRLPGGGFKQDGTPSQGKAIVWGTIAASTADTGIALDSYLQKGIRNLGLETLDLIDIQVSAYSGGTLTNDALYFFNLDTASGGEKIHHLENVGQANPKPIDAGDTVTLKFWAVGDILTGSETA